MTHGRWLLAATVLAVGCGGSAFTAATGSDASPDGPESGSYDSSTSADGSKTDSSVATDSAVGDALAASDATGGDAESGSPEAAEEDSGGDDGGLDATGDDVLEASAPDEGADAGGGDASADGAADAMEDAEACAPVVYYLDGDGDGYGGTTTYDGCLPPDSGTWVTVGGDCDDSNATVNPGQAAYFAVGYVPTGKTDVSFDYNCDGEETESGDPAKADCAFVKLSCEGSGYIEATPVRSGVGVDPYCGSAQTVSCVVSSLTCQAGAPATASPIACH